MQKTCREKEEKREEKTGRSCRYMYVSGRVEVKKKKKRKRLALEMDLVSCMEAGDRDAT